MMRRISILLGLLLLLWFVSEDDSVAGNLSTAAVPPQQISIGGTPQQPRVNVGESCCLQGTNPHYEFIGGGGCQLVYTCGYDDYCFPGCDANLRDQCFAAERMWDENTCTCITPSCDPSGFLQGNCQATGGSWNSETCVCTPGACNPTPPVVVGGYPNEYSYCIDCYTRYTCQSFVFCYEQYCQDGSLYNSFCQESGGTCFFEQDAFCQFSCNAGG
jgi:hypothetical protein